MNATDKKYQSSLAGIDLLRLLLSLCVVIFHYRMFLRPFTGREKVPASLLPLNGVLGFVYEHGGYAVEIFWLISGFIFYRIYAAAIADGKVGFKTFGLLRFSRLYPLHLLTLLVVAVLQLVYQRQHGVYFGYPANDVASFIRHLFLVNQWGDFGISYNGPVWSVSVEVFVYLLFYVLCALGALRRRGVLLVWGIAVICYHFQFPKPFSECMYYFFSGCLLCYGFNKPYKPLYLLAAAVVLTCFFGGLTMLTGGENPLHNTLRTTAGVAASSVLLLCFIYWFSKVKSARILAFIQWCGNITYSTYLIHFPIMLAAMLVIHPQSPEMFREVWTLVVFVTLVVVMGSILYRFYEKPVQDALRRKWRV